MSDGSLGVMSPLEAPIVSAASKSGASKSSPLASSGASDDNAAASQPIVTITPAALAELVKLRDEEPDADKLGLRLAVASNPGEEFRYDLSFDEFLTAAFTDEVRTTTAEVIVPGRRRAVAGRDARPNDNQGLVIRNPNRRRHRRSRALTGDDACRPRSRHDHRRGKPGPRGSMGFVSYVGHDGEGTAYTTMGGGCHGCSMRR